jgi:DNA/RNA endonuclease YhcR with UshA esterase domain
MRSILPLLLVMTITTASITSAEGQGMRIADARRLPLGETVTVEGVVSVASGVIDAGFAVQDASGGIYVDADSATRLGESQRVRATGRLVTSHGLLRIAPSSIDALGRGDATYPEPRIATGRVGEATEGRIIRAEGTIVGEIVDDSPYGWKITIDDGSGPLLVFLSPGAKIDVSRFRAGQRLRVTGFSGQYDDHAEILPRSETDVEIVSGR